MVASLLGVDDDILARLVSMHLMDPMRPSSATNLVEVSLATRALAPLLREELVKLRMENELARELSSRVGSTMQYLDELLPPCRGSLTQYDVQAAQGA